MKPIENLTYTDDGMFQAVMHEQKICKEIVERLLHIQVGHIDYPDLEKTIAPYYTSKGIRMDVYLKDSDRVIDVEMQARSRSALGKRTRYYQSMIDIDSLLKGQDYSELKESYILFICKEDPFDKDENEKFGLPCYTFKTMCAENPNVNLNDKTTKVVYNSSAWEKEKDQWLRNYLHYIFTNETGEDDFSRELSTAVEKKKQDEKFRSLYLSMNLHDRDIRMEAMKEAKEQKALEATINLLKMNVLTPEQIAQATGLPLEKVLELQKSILVEA